VEAALAAKSLLPRNIPSALQWGSLQIATMSRFRRQKTTTHTFIAKRHKTVHAFFDEF